MSDALRSVRNFDHLVQYLEYELDWPLQGYGVEDLTFDYEPQELGLKPDEAVKVKTVRQLRPLAGGQAWGIFFLEFEKKRLPIVVLRRILRHLVVKRRASADAAERKHWQVKDLLFISAWGEEAHREMTFAHFLERPEAALAELRVLGWDADDTVLHTDLVASILREKLRWDAAIAGDPDAWPERWREAFRLQYRHVIKTSADLAEALAVLAKRIRARIEKVLEMESGDGEMRTLQRAFQIGLIHDLDDAGFADMFAQTVTYGLFSLACRRTSDEDGSTAFVKEDLTTYFTSPFLKEMLGIFLGIKSYRGRIDFDELGIAEVTDLLTSPDTHMRVVLADFGNKTRQEDPVIHFYEHFLSAYNKKLKVQRGVFYTPQPVVSYIVRSVHELLQTEFGLEHGLADTTTWGEMIQRNSEMKLPPLTDEPGETRTISPDEMFVQILDPATGTATFPVEVIDVIHRHLQAKWKEGGLATVPLFKSDAPKPKSFEDYWNLYVPQALLPRLHGYELMMAPYAIAHMKLGLKLAETGFRFQQEVQARIFLTNALEPKVSQLPALGFEALANEASAVNEIKWYRRFTVVIGNPPYSVTSANFNAFIDSLMDDYKRHVRGEKGLVALADDYLKFVRLSQKLLADPNCGVWGMITNHGYLKGVIHRGVRRELLEQFNSMFILDLHGDSNIGERVPAGKENENVFDIQQGVAVSIGVRALGNASAGSARHCDVWGGRSEKYDGLVAHPVSLRKWTDLLPVKPRYFLIPFDDANLAEYEDFPSINELMAVNSCGVKTHRDGIMIDFDKKKLTARISEIASERRLERLRERYGIIDTPNWRLEEAQQKIEANEVPQYIHRLSYRPFDYRWIYYNPAIIEKGDSKYPTLRHMLRSNVALLSARIQATGVFDAVFVSKFLVEMKTAESSRSCTVFPLFLTDDDNSRQAQFSPDGLRPNLNPKVLLSWAQKLDLKVHGDFGLPVGVTPEDIFHYVYAVFHSPGYRSRYAEFLKIDFPRLPLTGSLELFRALAQLGGELTALHLLESPQLAEPITEFIGTNNQVSKVIYTPDNGGTVWIDGKGTAKKPQPGTSGFSSIPKEVWNFHIGGYQVCEKWLKDRGPKKGQPGRTLTDEDIAHYHKIVIALTETIRLMTQIDEAIDTHGGWPGAFVTGDADAKSADVNPAPKPKPGAKTNSGDLGLQLEDELPLG